MAGVTRDRETVLLEEVRRAIAFTQPDLVARLTASGVRISGRFHVVSDDPERRAAGPLATYDVRIEVPFALPDEEPRLLEVAGTIPRDADHHVNPDGSCCYGVWEAIRITHPAMDIAEFLHGPVRQYLLGQRHFAEHGCWPWGELAHGAQGIVEAFAAILKCEARPRLVHSRLRHLTAKWIRGRWPCGCGSNRRLRECCLPGVAAVSDQIRPAVARRMLIRLDLALKHKKTTPQSQR